jgi:hypothetical protein
MTRSRHNVTRRRLSRISFRAGGACQRSWICWRRRRDRTESQASYPPKEDRNARSGVPLGLAPPGVGRQK